jgi:hypothetical protein
MFLQHDDIDQAGGHSHIQIGLRAIDPPGEAHFKHDVVCALAQRFGLTDPTSTHRCMGPGCPRPPAAQ